MKRSDAMAAALRAIGKGGRVQSTPLAITNGLWHATKYGVITGWGRHKWTVQVQPDRRKTSSAYHVDFWEPETWPRGRCLGRTRSRRRHEPQTATQ